MKKNWCDYQYELDWDFDLHSISGGSLNKKHFTYFLTSKHQKIKMDLHLSFAYKALCSSFHEMRMQFSSQDEISVDIDLDISSKNELSCDVDGLTLSSRRLIKIFFLRPKIEILQNNETVALCSIKVENGKTMFLIESSEKIDILALMALCIGEEVKCATIWD